MRCGSGAREAVRENRLTECARRSAERLTSRRRVRVAGGRAGTWADRQDFGRGGSHALTGLHVLGKAAPAGCPGGKCSPRSRCFAHRIGWGCSRLPGYRRQGLPGGGNSVRLPLLSEQLASNIDERSIEPIIYCFITVILYILIM